MAGGENEAVLDIAEFIMGIVTALSFLTYVISVMDVSVTGIMSKDVAYAVNAMISIPHTFSHTYSFDSEVRRLSLRNPVAVEVRDSESSSLNYIIPSRLVSLRTQGLLDSSYTIKSRFTDEGRQIYLDGGEDIQAFCESFGADPSRSSIRIDNAPAYLQDNTYGSGSGFNIDVVVGERNRVVYSRLLNNGQKALLCNIFDNMMSTDSSLYFTFEESPDEIKIEIKEDSEEVLDIIDSALAEEVVSNE